MAPPHSVWKGPTAGDVGPYNGKLESQASYEENLPVPPMGSDTGDVNDDVDEEAPEEAYAVYPMTTYAGDPALALKVVTFPAGQAGGNVHHLLNFDKSHHASPKLCSEEHSPTAKGNGRYKKGSVKVLTRSSSAVLRLDFLPREAHESEGGSSHDQLNKLLKLMGGYRCAYNQIIELLGAAGYGAGKKGLVAPSIDPAMKDVISDCVTKEGTNRGQKRKAGDDEEEKANAADYEAALAKLNSGRIAADQPAIVKPVGFREEDPQAQGLPGATTPARLQGSLPGV
jgi:hypothetical protein